MQFTSDAGLRWQTITPPEHPGERIEAVTFLRDGPHGWVYLAENSLAITSDSGKSWASVSAPLDERTRSNRANVNLSFADPKNGWLAVQWQSTASASDGFLFRTVDGGSAWTKCPDPPIYGNVRFDSATHGAIQGGAAGYALFVSFDAGDTWVESKIVLQSSLPNAPFSAGLVQMELPVFPGTGQGTLRVIYHPGGDVTETVRYLSSDGGRN